MESKLLTFLPIILTAVAVSAADKPNIVLLLSDDQAWTDYGFMGHPNVRTSNIDQLAQESVAFPRGYVPTALCRPSLMTLATGHYAHQHGITGNDPSPKYAERDSPIYNRRRTKLISYIDRFDTLPELLGEAGYLSHQSGKWWEGNYSLGGFTHGMTRGYPQPGGRHGDDGLKIGREGLKEIYDFVDMAVKQDKPFYIWYAAFLPHTPHNPPERLLKKYRNHHPISIAKYYAMIEWWDETCGELIAYLEGKSIRDNTLIVYVGDNGWIQNPERNGFALRSKQTPYEGGIRQPTLYSWPAKLKPAHRTDLVSSIDIFPTMLAAAGTRNPKIEVPGLNLLPNMEKGTAIPRNAIFGESFAHDIADIENPEASLLFRWVIEDDWKLLLTYNGEVNRHAQVHPRDEKRPQLFNLQNDPHEKTNMAALNPKIVERMAKMIGDWYPVTERKVLTKFE
ncbi:MAG: sulfatase [Opitutaceae bacterium]|nr:sulfatase [Opitutaceae bacterium]|tara:strand:- start:2936 stop:4288 length:1353 start_codon:yes stop_codon:yes gene_type:complete